jgi:hypothetical protein
MMGRLNRDQGQRRGVWSQFAVAGVSVPALLRAQWREALQMKFAAVRFVHEALASS